MMESQLNCELNACLLRCVINASNEYDHQTLRDLGLNTVLVDRAKNMNADVFSRLSRFSIANITFDSHRFGLMLDFVEQEREMDILVNKMIQLDASQSMLGDLTGIDPREYRDRRKALNMPPASQGRPQNLDDQQTIILYEALSKYPEPKAGSSTNDMLNWYCQLGAETELPLAKIWQQNLNFG
ncbi:MAG: STY4526/YPO1902 family pathogenicity island replication protein [Gammaproteobacteria bacterium]|nr:STY4526/YPO1902 family pathogenicity island replication protein [Gammaproteobacteria bacterium]